MFCQQCGSQLAEGARFCAHCGRAQVIAAVPANPADTRVSRHIRLLAILWMARAGLTLLGGAVTLFIGRMFMPIFLRAENGVPGFVPALVAASGWLILLMAIPSLAVGIGLYNRDSWARTLALVMGFLALLSPILGTALGIYTLWVLLPSNSDREYQSLTRAA